MPFRRLLVAHGACLLLSLSGLLVLFGGSSLTGAAEYRIRSDTLVRYFERADTREGGERVLPIYEYLNLDYGSLELPGLSFHGYGWGRVALGEELLGTRSAGEILYGYLQYAAAESNATARLGRQHVFDGVSGTALDGLRVSSDVTQYFTVSAFGGQPLSVEEVNGRSGDLIWGGRLSHRWGNLYDVGLGYKRLVDDGDRESERLHIDSSLSPPGPLTIWGYSVRNLVDDRWAEHSYEVQATLGTLVLRPAYQRVLFDSFFDEGRATASPFRFLGESRERITVIGGDALWSGIEALEVGVRVKNYDYRQRDDNAWYYAGLVTLHGGRLTQVGAEAGRMEGDTRENRYTLLKGYGYWDGEPGSVSADLVYTRYDEEVLDRQSSIFTSLSAGKAFYERALEVKVSADYSRDPFVDHELRGMVTIKYRLGS
jgi:hypothetical protein